MRGAALLAAALALGACTTTAVPPRECPHVDWRAVGLADGAEGRGRDRLAEHRANCAEVGVVPDADAWETGRQEGLEAYCTPTVAFRLGVEGRRMNPVCPASLRPELEAANDLGFREGLRLRRAEAWLYGPYGPVGWPYGWPRPGWPGAPWPHRR